MLVISCWQPWAALVVVGAKQIETRSRRTHHRGQLGIHATRTCPAWAREFAARPAIQEAVHRAAPDLIGQWGELFPAGKLLGTVVVTDCCATNQTALRTTGEILPPPEGTFEHLVGDYSADRFMWLLENPERLAVPVPARGGQFLWNYQGAL